MLAREFLAYPEIHRLRPKDIVHVHGRFSSKARPASHQLRVIGMHRAGCSGTVPLIAQLKWSSSPSLRNTTASYASQSSQALSTIALSTGPTSVGEDAITLRMLAAAGLVGQRLREVARALPAPPRTVATFSIAITAWSAKSAAARSACR